MGCVLFVVPGYRVSGNGLTGFDGAESIELQLKSQIEPLCSEKSVPTAQLD